MSSSTKVLVTTATGNQGAGVVRHCLKAGHEVHALVRDPSSPAAKALAELGATLVQGDLDDPNSLQSAMRNMDAVFLNLPSSLNRTEALQRAKNTISAARSSPTVSAMVCSTAVKTGQHETFTAWGPQHPMYDYWLSKHAIENLVRSAGFLHWTIVRPTHLLQNFQSPLSTFCFPGFAQDRVLRVAYKPTTKLAFVDAADVGIVVAAAISYPEKYSGREIDLAVDELTIGELAQKISKALGTEVKVEFYSDEKVKLMQQMVEASNKEFSLRSVDEFFAEATL
ncbi:NAD dependent epimerase/dehydratase [Pseudomassariella vexata]|uniref:NAD dependent epimerase/dehydratase n=1 Tax=Pseudomassariella vexata TaxID=1141098 RepID=A0A1Y2DIS9_9PEZI|nr:NAD dependent epimerase/dehydratase [Pseudomassariella vexata]ORY58735.1 NAD dependent epimerase/dehydratase [Pseudomassariella vexata]